MSGHHRYFFDLKNKNCKSLCSLVSALGALWSASECRILGWFCDRLLSDEQFGGVDPVSEYAYRLLCAL